MPPKKLETTENAQSMPEWIVDLQGKTEAEVRATFPHLVEFLPKVAELGGQPAIRIVSKVEGFRRGGRSHGTKAVVHPLSEFTPVEIERILAEPLLIVEPANLTASTAEGAEPENAA